MDSLPKEATSKAACCPDPQFSMRHKRRPLSAVFKGAPRPGGWMVECEAGRDWSHRVGWCVSWAGGLWVKYGIFHQLAVTWVNTSPQVSHPYSVGTGLLGPLLFQDSNPSPACSGRGDNDTAQTPSGMRPLCPSPGEPERLHGWVPLVWFAVPSTLLK